MPKSWYDAIPKGAWGEEGDTKPEPTAIGANQTQQPTGSKAYYDKGMEAIGALATGTSPIYKTTENIAKQDFGGAQLAAIGSSKQRSAEAGYSPEAIGAVSQTTQRAIEGERTDVLRDIVQAKQRIAVPAATQLATSGLAGAQYEDAKKQGDWSRMLQYYDPGTPEGLKALQSGYVEMFGGTAPDLNVLTEQREFARTKREQDVAIGATEVAAAEQAEADQRHASMISRIASGVDLSSLNEEFGANLTQEEYDKMWEATDTYFTSRGLDMNEASLYGYTDDNGNHVKGALEIAAGNFGLNVGSYEDQKKQMWGWTDEDGTHHEGIYDRLTEDQKMKADATYGYDTTDADGNPVHIMGTLELQNSADEIRRQGLSITEAQVKGYFDPETGEWVKGSVQIAAERAGMEVSSLYGFFYNPETGEVVTDPEEISRLGRRLERVDGALQLNANRYGLESDTFDMQRDEMYGYTDDDGNEVAGRMGLLNSEDRRSADAFYGWDEEIFNTSKNEFETVHHIGTGELMDIEGKLREQDLTIRDAQIFGYELDGKHIPGELEIAGEKMEMIRAEYTAAQDSITGTQVASHFALMANTRGYSWRSDGQAQGYLQKYWESIGGTGDFDEDWADRQYEASTVGEIDAAMIRLEGSGWYKDMLKNNPEQAEDVRKVTELAAYLNITQGLVPQYDDKGQIVALNDSEGNTVWDTRAEEPPVGKIGETVLGGGGVVKIGVGGEAIEVSFDPEKDDIWGVTADRILALGKENNPFYNDVLDERVNSIMSGKTKISSKIPEDVIYDTVLDQAQSWEPKMVYDSRGFFKSDQRKFTNAPAQWAVINHQGTAYQVHSSATMDKSGQDSDVMELMNLETGEKVTLRITGKSGSDLKVTGW